MTERERLIELLKEVNTMRNMRQMMNCTDFPQVKSNSVIALNLLQIGAVNIVVMIF